MSQILIVISLLVFAGVNLFVAFKAGQTFERVVTDDENKSLIEAEDYNE